MKHSSLTVTVRNLFLSLLLKRGKAPVNLHSCSQQPILLTSILYFPINAKKHNKAPLLGQGHGHHTGLTSRLWIVCTNVVTFTPNPI
jgi:hypothetical protein